MAVPIGRIVSSMKRTMDSVNTPRKTALRELHEAEKGPLEILIGTILSARTRDENTTKVVKDLFSKYKTARELARADPASVQKIIKPCGFYRVKSKRIIEVASIIDSRFQGDVPSNLDDLVSLPGVGRKTANCVLVYAYDKPAVPVDTHVHRIANRLGIVNTKDVEETETQMMKTIPKKDWLGINDMFVMFGQNICKPISPLCSVCQLTRICKYYNSNNKKGKSVGKSAYANTSHTEVAAATAKQRTHNKTKTKKKSA